MSANSYWAVLIYRVHGWDGQTTAQHEANFPQALEFWHIESRYPAFPPVATHACMHLNVFLFQTKHTCTVSCASVFDYDNMGNGGFYCHQLNCCLIGRQTEKCFYHPVENGWKSLEIDCYSYLTVIKFDVPVFPLNQREFIFDLTALIVTLLASQKTEFFSAFSFSIFHWLFVLFSLFQLNQILVNLFIRGSHKMVTLI